MASVSFFFTVYLRSLPESFIREASCPSPAFCSCCDGLRNVEPPGSLRVKKPERRVRLSSLMGRLLVSRALRASSLPLGCLRGCTKTKDCESIESRQTEVRNFQAAGS